jgi:hypothetical protein
LDGQRVKFLTTGYLRGWLDFKYPQRSSRLREEIILRSIEEEIYLDLFKERLQKDYTIFAGLAKKPEKLFKSIDDAHIKYVGLKLPELAKEFKIEEKKTLPPQTLAEMRSILEAAKKQIANPIQPGSPPDK